MLRDGRIFLSFDRNVRLFLLAWALTAFGYFGVQAVLLNLYLLRLGFDTAFIGALTAAGQLVWAAAALPAGALGRRLGLRAALLGGSLCATLGMGLLLSVPALPRGLWVADLYLGWSVMWVGAALLTVNSIPYVLAASPAGQATHAFAAQGGVMAVFGFAGSLVAGALPGQLAGWLGSALDQPAPYWWALWLVPLAHALAVGAWALTRPVHVAESHATQAAAPRPWALFLFLGLIVYLQTAGEGTVRAFYTVYLDLGLRLPAAPIGLIVGVGQLLPVILVLVVPKLLGRWGTVLVLLGASLGAGLASLPLVLWPHWAPAAIGFLGWMSMLAVMGPSRSIFSQELVSARWQATTAAIATVGSGLGWASVALAGGYLIPLIGFSGLFVISGLLPLLAAGLLGGYVWLRAGRPAPEALELTPQ